MTLGCLHTRTAVGGTVARAKEEVHAPRPAPRRLGNVVQIAFMLCSGIFKASTTVRSRACARTIIDSGGEIAGEPCAHVRQITKHGGVAGGTACQ